jgi:hypothetical protein
MQSADFDRGSAACFLPRKTLEWIQSGQRFQKTDSSAPDFLGAPRTVSSSLVLAAQAIRNSQSQGQNPHRLRPDKLVESLPGNPFGHRNLENLRWTSSRRRGVSRQHTSPLICRHQQGTWFSGIVSASSTPTSHNQNEIDPQATVVYVGSQLFCLRFYFSFPRLRGRQNLGRE